MPTERKPWPTNKSAVTGRVLALHLFAKHHEEIIEAAATANAAKVGKDAAKTPNDADGVETAAGRARRDGRGREKSRLAAQVAQSLTENSLPELLSYQRGSSSRRP